MGTLAALNQNVRLQRLNYVVWRIIVERDNVIDAGESGQDFHPLGQWVSSRSLEPVGRFIAVDADNQQVALLLGPIEQEGMASMKEAEATVCEDDSAVMCLELFAGFQEVIQAHNLVLLDSGVHHGRNPPCSVKIERAGRKVAVVRIHDDVLEAWLADEVEMVPDFFVVVSQVSPRNIAAAWMVNFHCKIPWERCPLATFI